MTIENKLNALTENFRTEMATACTDEKQKEIFNFYRDGFKGWGFTGTQAANMVRVMLVAIAPKGHFSNEYISGSVAGLSS